MITLREINRADLLLINKWRNNEKLIEFLGANHLFITKEIDDKWFDDYLTKRKENVRCAILEDDRMVGVVYLTSIDRINRSAEYHIMIGADMDRGKGYGYQGSLLILKHAFEDLNLNRVQLTVLENNEPAVKMYEKLGFKKEGLLRETVFKKGEYKNQLIMSMLFEEYKNLVTKK